MSTGRPPFVLEQLADISRLKYATPAKRINDREDLEFFFVSVAYRDLTRWLLQLNRAMFPTKHDNGDSVPCTLQPPPLFSKHVERVKVLLDSLSALITQAPPDTGPRRFGNVAFRKWYQLADDSATSLLTTHLDGILSLPLQEDDGKPTAANDELRAYLLGSFGSAQRLDYGTGHELSFLAFLGCLWKLGVFKEGEERAIIVGLIQPYLELIRKLILTYTLEPAGSHGVWGLDDHSFIPYIFGSAQLGPPIPDNNHATPVPTEGSLSTAPSPSLVTDKAVVRDVKDSNMYFSAIQFIYDVKKGPFWEHSPVLYDISGIKDGWGKINKGMLKMYAAEVLGKFPVVQHFPFGSLFVWEKDPNAQHTSPTVHTQQQPTGVQSRETPIARSMGTAAPWTRGAGPIVLPHMEASTGMPSTRAPWASRQTTVGQSTSLPPTATPRASRRQQPLQDAGHTAAPWAKRDSQR